MQEITSQINRGNFVLAEKLCRQRLAEQPGDIPVNFLLAFVLWRESQPEEALKWGRKALELAPADPGLLSDLGNLLRELGAHAEALGALDKSLELRPGNSGACYNRALVLDAMGRDKETMQLLEEISPGDPLFVKARFLRGTIRQDFGDTAGAEADFRDCIEANPDNAEAWYALASTRSFKPAETIFGELERQLSRSAASSVQRSHYHFALAKVLDDTGQYDAASEHLLSANSLVDAGYDGPGIDSRLKLLCEQFQSPVRCADSPHSTPAPVFIVGLPRSGTTLLEALLERHPGVLALGELDLLPALISDFRQPPDTRDLHDNGKQYLAALPPESRQASVVLDKMPGNFWRLGHITLMLPGAKIIHCHRDPRDVAISNFFNLYSTGNSFSYSLDHIAHYTACHDAVMAHWKSLMGDRIFSLDYAELVADPQRNMIAVTGFIGLDWDDDMLTAPPEKRRIRTASKWQARQEIYTTSIERWRLYPYLADEFTAHYRKYSGAL